MDKYATYTIVDFASDTSFIRYVKNLSVSDSQFWEQWLSSHPAKRSDVEEAKKLVLSLSPVEEKVDAQVKESLWSKIDQQTAQHSGRAPTAKIRRIKWAQVAVAASIMMLFAITFLIPSSSQTISADIAENVSTTLPDLSKVTLNAASRIAYNKKKWDANNRLVTLKGEAFFEVKKGEKFTVETALGEVEVLGTSFNVMHRPPYFEVTCYTGKVAVRNTSGTQEYIITPGEKVTFDPETEEGMVEEVSSTPAPTWLDGTSSFVDKPLSFVINELERQYEVKVKNVPLMPYTGSFDKESLSRAVYDICWPLKLDYTIDSTNNIVVIHK